ncbi:nucleoside phosphorylase [Raineya orbicola]|uniref:Uridine phosphorylase n=1 Tax=Raineya orbicola TaxID=2016530 RepID=A0A2N3IHR0_9BACT|nr:nucleoside phosphorylase [Raineya orbicola]PKQ69847.1 Uridine phosphorylase [Raineya orbicola]
MNTIPPSELIINKDGSIYHLNLKPENIAEIILVVGDPNRVHKISKYFDKVEFEMNKREFITHTGVYKGKRITAISSGMGTDNVEILLTELDALVNIDLKKRQPKSEHTTLKIIRIGTSGALQAAIGLDSFVASSYGLGIDTLMTFYNLEQTDFEKNFSLNLQKNLQLPFTPYCVSASEKLLRTFAFDMIKGVTITAPGFYAPQGRKVRLPIRYPYLVDALSYFHCQDTWITNFEMETAGYYAMARLLGHEMLSLNAIVANRITQEFSKNAEKTIDELIRLALERVEKL